MHKLIFLLFSFCIIFTFAGFTVLQKATAIILHDEKLSFTTNEFYITNVTDYRNDHSSVALLINANVAHPEPVDLQGGAANAIKLFVDHNLHKDTRLRPIVITIKEFKLTESNLPGGRIDGNLSVMFSFALQRGEESIHLLDYTGGIHYNRDIKQTDIAEPALRHGIENALLYFTQWMNKQADTNPLLAKAVRVGFTDYNEKNEGDTVYYSVNRPLTWDDFKDKPRVERFDAEIFSSIGYSEQAEVVKGIINIDISLRVDVPKSDCWVRAGSRSDYTLNHEQRHFDIEKLVSEYFKQKILAMSLPPENFDGPINVEYLETLREATRIQKQYDAETRHGADQQAQAQWNEKIDKELKMYGVKK